MAEDEQPTRFAPVVLLGAASAAVLAVTGARDWFVVNPDGKILLGVTDADRSADMPLALALALVLLAAWGVVLVTRSRARRLVLVVAGMATLGVGACLVRAPFVLPDQIRTGLAYDGPTNADPKLAYVVACVALPLALAAIAAGWRYVPRWPEMSSRYDAPTARSTEQEPAAELADLELWKALDEGRDPTER
jgi:hypothetical protein